MSADFANLHKGDIILESCGLTEVMRYIVLDVEKDDTGKQSYKLYIWWSMWQDDEERGKTITMTRQHIVNYRNHYRLIQSPVKNYYKTEVNKNKSLNLTNQTSR